MSETQTGGGDASRPPVAALAVVSGLALLAIVGGAVALFYHAQLQGALANAEKQRRLAEEAREGEQVQRQRAEAALALGEGLSYLLRIERVPSAWRDKDLVRIDRDLDACPPPLRAWEWRYLKRLAHADLLTLATGAGPVTGVCFSPDGKLLAAGCGLTDSEDRRSAPGTVKVWDPHTGREVHSLQGHKGIVTAVAFSPDGMRVASAGTDGAVLVWDLVTGKPTALPSQDGPLAGMGFGPAGRPQPNVGVAPPGGLPVTAVAFSPDGGLLAWAGQGMAVTVWDLEAGRKTATLKGHTNAVEGLAFSPDGKQLASAGADGTARVWDVAAGQEAALLSKHRDAVHAVAFSPDGKRLASASKDQAVIVWDLAAGREALVLEGHAAPVTGVCFSPDGRRLATASADRTVKLWDAGTGKPAQTLYGHTDAVHGVAFSPDGSCLASGSSDQTAKLWDVRPTGESIALEGHPDAVYGVCFSPDSARVASAGWDGTLRLWDVVTRQAVLVLKGHPGGTIAAAYSPDGTRLASGGKDRKLRVWDAHTGRELLAFTGHDDTVYTVAWAPDGTRLASGSRDGAVKLWDAQTGEEAVSLTASESFVTGVAFSPDGQRVATSGGDGLVKLWEAATGREVMALRGHADCASGVAFSPDGRLIAAGGWDHTVRVWDAATGQEVFALTGHADRVWAVAFSPDGRRLASAAYDQTVKLWDLHTGQEALTLKEHADKVLAVAFSSDGKWLTTAGRDRTVRLWDGEGVTPEARLVRLEAVERSRPAWHLQEAEAALAVRNLGAARFHLRFAAGADFNAAGLVRRGQAHARVGQWEEARADYIQAVARQAEPATVWYRNALLQARAGDAPGYRKACAAMLEHFGDEDDVAVWVTAACVLAPKAVADYARPLQLARDAAARSPRDHDSVLLLGALLLRAGQPREALEKLNEADTLQGNDPFCWLFLALAHDEVGKADLCREQLTKAARWLDNRRERYAAGKGPSWDEWEALDLLRRDVEKHLGEQGR